MSTDFDENETRDNDRPSTVQSGNVVGAGDSGGNRRPGQAVRALGGRTNLAEVQLNDDHVSTILALREREIENEDRQSEREHNDRKESRRVSSALAVIAILAVVGIIVFLVAYEEPGLLGYILSGIGGLIAGAFGGYGYARR